MKVCMHFQFTRCNLFSCFLLKVGLLLFTGVLYSSCPRLQKGGVGGQDNCMWLIALIPRVHERALQGVHHTWSHAWAWGRKGSQVPKTTDCAPLLHPPHLSCHCLPPTCFTPSLPVFSLLHHHTSHQFHPLLIWEGAPKKLSIPC